MEKLTINSTQNSTREYSGCLGCEGYLTPKTNTPQTSEGKVLSGNETAYELFILWQMFTMWEILVLQVVILLVESNESEKNFNQSFTNWQ